MKTDIPRIAESEWRVMKVLWQKAPLTANEIVDILVKNTNWKPKTINRKYLRGSNLISSGNCVIGI